MERFAYTPTGLRIRPITTLVIVGASVFLSAAPFAKVMRMSLREKVNASDLIVRGTVTSVTSKGGKVGFAELRIEEALYGERGVKNVRIVVTGDEEEPIYGAGDEVITFLYTPKGEERERYKSVYGMDEGDIGFRTVNGRHGPFYINDELAKKEGPLSGKRSLLTEKQAECVKREIMELLVELKKIAPQASGLAERELEYIAIRGMTDVAIDLTKADEQRFRIAVNAGKREEAQKIAETLRSRVKDIIHKHESLLEKYPDSADIHNSHGLILYENG